MIDRFSNILYYVQVRYLYAVVAQSVARRLGKAEVTGSSPANSLYKKRIRKYLILFFLFSF